MKQTSPRGRDGIDRFEPQGQRQACNFSGRLQEIKHPTLVLVGDKDHGSATGASHRVTSEALAKYLPNGQYAVIPNEAHNYFTTNPDGAHRIIRQFLAANSQGALCAPYQLSSELS